MKEKKRFQECSNIEKIWRYRWYLAIPFRYVYHRINKVKIYLDKEINGEIVHTDEYEYYPVSRLWSLCKSEATSKMQWYHTMDEMKEIKKEWIKEYKKEKNEDLN